MTNNKDPNAPAPINGTLRSQAQESQGDVVDNSSTDVDATLCGTDEFGVDHLNEAFPIDGRLNIKLISGEQVIATVAGSGYDEIGGEYVEVFKPAIIAPVALPQGGQGHAFVPWMVDGTHIYVSAIIAHATELPKNMEAAYIQFSTGIKVEPASKIHVS